MSRSADLLDRYDASLLGVFGRPGAVLSHGQGCRVWDVDGRSYLDLLAGIAVNSLGHGHPALVEAITRQAAHAVHVSNFFTTRPQVELAERLLAVAGAPEGSAVFLTNSGTEAIEAAIKLARRTGRTRIVAMEGAFHGRSTGALALTHKPAHREPFLPLLPGISHVPLGDEAALRAAVDETVAAVVVEPIQGEAGVRVADPAYLQLVREVTAERGALMVVDEIQTGVGRTGQWFAHQLAGTTPDAVTVAKGLAGGVPIGALLTYGRRVTGLLGPGQHGTTFGGNPLAAAAGLAVLETIERDHLLEHARRTGEELQRLVTAIGHPVVREVRGRGLLQAIQLADDRAQAVARRALAAGFIVNPVTPSALRLAPPLIITAEELATFVDALPDLLDQSAPEEAR
ncbi:MAG TPA: acetylornithine transaminase [Segeticoccus sp.]|jgi:acetylornithine aminotransferase|nr:acetylornithine transaminase [Segeticoccus sp.]